MNDYRTSSIVNTESPLGAVSNGERINPTDFYDAAVTDAAELRRLLHCWIEAAAQYSRNEKFYHGIVIEIGNMFGAIARTADDGTVGDSVHALKVPALVAAAIAAAPRCACNDRAASACPGEWEPGCDLGANEKYMRAGTEADAQTINKALGITSSWQPWHGGRHAPVGDLEMLVNYRMRDGDVLTGEVGLLYWEHDDEDADIVAWRVAVAPVPEK